ncbi:MAG: serine hydrolase domain-containing protein, partial [Anaerolineales bacterium]
MLKFRILLLVFVPILILGAEASNLVSVFGISLPAQEPPLRTSEPVDELVGDLEDFIPAQMEEEGIPGVAVALIRDGEVAWAEGFGVANLFTGEPVTADTVFEVASISKVVTAYTALRLVDQGLLSLDEPVGKYLSEPWLPPSE